MPDKDRAKGEHLELDWAVRDPLHAKIDSREMPTIPFRKINREPKQFGMKYFTCQRGSRFVGIGGWKK